MEFNFNRCGQGIRGSARVRLGLWPGGKESGVQQHQSEDHAESRSGNPRRQEGSGDGAQSSGDFQKHPDPDVGKAFFQKSRSGPGRSCDHRNQSGADGVTDVDAEEQRQHRGDDDAPSEPRQSAQKTGCGAECTNHQAEFERVQVVSLSLSDRQPALPHPEEALHQHLEIHNAQKPG